MNELDAFARANFDWVVHLDAIWEEPLGDVPELHDHLRRDITAAVGNLEGHHSPIGRIIIGPGGSGKTHLLSVLRGETLRNGATFIAADLTDVHDFYETVLLGYVNSLLQPDASGKPQFRSFLAWLINEVGAPVDGMTYVNQLRRCSPEQLHKVADHLVQWLSRRWPQESLRHDDVLRALLLMNMRDMRLQSAGHSWLQGAPVDREDLHPLKFDSEQRQASEIIRGLSWLLSLRGPTLLALDQLDAIVGQHHLTAAAEVSRGVAEGQLVSQAIITGIAGGLAALRDLTRRTLTVVSAYERTVQTLKQYGATSFMERYTEEEPLRPLQQQALARKLIEARLKPVYEAAGFEPDYPTWPFSPKALDNSVGLLPRELLMRCEAHRKACVRAGEATELHSLDGAAPSPDVRKDDLDPIDRVFETYKAQAEPDRLLRHETEDTALAGLLKTAARCLVKENPVGENVDALVDSEFPGGKSFAPLHARIRLVHHDKDGLERHYCLRALQKTHATAYQSRLKAAMTSAGIDRQLDFRRLVIVRIEPPPTGPKSKELTEKFLNNGGIFVAPGEQEIRVLWALQQLEAERRDGFESWLINRRPVSAMTMMQEAKLSRGIDIPPRNEPSAAANQEIKPAPANEPGNNRANKTADKPPSKPPKAAVTKKATEPSKSHTAVSVAAGGGKPGMPLPIGHRLVGSQIGDAITVPLEKLRQHVVVLAGAGSGKTVLIRRIVEEAALVGVPSIVIDSANDLARLGDAWPETPEEWRNGDAEKAEAYFENAETVIWTPGIEGGNPLRLEPLPDLAAVVDNRDELNEAIAMARDALQPIVATGRSAATQTKLGVLSAALEYFANQGGGNLSKFVDLLADLPPDAGGGITDAEKHATKMADALRAQFQIDPLLKQEGAVLDPAELFGLENPNGKTRVSVLSFIGLQGDEQQQQFLNQLAMTLFSWIKRNPAPNDQALRGLLVIDEAKDFVPSKGTPACKASLVRLAAQARKYGLGLVFATQAPKDIEHTVVSNCFTHIYGQANSPAAIEAIKTQLQQKGGSGSDIGKLGRGRFYFYSDGVVQAPTKMAASMCLSHHPAAPLGQDDVMKRARQSKDEAG